jgi:hypothetical protein
MTIGYELHEQPDLDSPVLIMGLDGWIDAGYAAANAATTLLAELRSFPVATFDSDELLDHRSRRPVMHLIDGVNTGLSWPGIELRAAVDEAGNDLLLLVGAEPDHTWRSFSAAVVQLAIEFGTRMVVGLGAYPAAVPHTRAALLSCTASTPELSTAWPFLRGTLEVPAGVQAAIERQCADAGLPAIGLWAQVPHYASGMAYPSASLSLIETAAMVGGLVLPTGKLTDEAAATRLRLDELISGNPEHAALVEALEEQVDEQATAGPLPSGDELAAEVEDFLREQGRESP